MKRKPSLIVLSEPDPDNTIVGASRPAHDNKRQKRQKSLSDINPSQAQNIRSRTLQCVLIPPLDRASLLSLNRSTTPQKRNMSHRASSATGDMGTSAQQSVSHRASSGTGILSTSAQRSVSQGGSSVTGVLGTAARPKRATARQSIVEELFSSDDELSCPFVTVAKKRPSKGIPLDVGSDFEMSDSQPESEATISSEEESRASGQSDESEVSLDEGYGSGTKKKKASPATKGDSKKTTAATKPNAKAKNQAEKQAATRMHRLLRTGEARSLDQNLPPLNNIDDIFADMAAKATSLGLGSALKHINRPIRVATMCSGTESPLVALQQILDKSGLSSLKLDHQFSAEIVPYKQAYIERNFNPPLIFRDVGEITDAVHDEIPMATTAYGAKAQIPISIDILIAGTSCKDFSALNNYQRGLDEQKGGESSKTWFGVLAYCKAFRPAIVIIENVLHAPWDRMLEYYEETGYDVAGCLVDTKNYYLPQTRQRGYLVAFDKSKSGAAEGAGEVWTTLMARFQRYASSPVTEFMLPNDVARVKQQSRSTLDDSTKEWAWEACKIRHVETRRTELLGNGRPFTHWSESGLISTPENGFTSWYRKQPDRIRDYLEIAGLRKAPIYDVRYKSRLMDLSQNIHLTSDSVPFGIIGCITPTGILFASDAGRALMPEEALILQGLPMNRIGFTTETKSEIQDLAGNAMSTTVVGAAILSALIAGGGVLQSAAKKAEGDTLSVEQEFVSMIGEEDDMEVLNVCLDGESIDVSQLLNMAHKSARRCLCEGSNMIAAKPIQQCTSCLHTTCTACGGNPSHHYHTATGLNRARTSPVDFEAYLRSKLPLRLSFGHDPVIGQLNGCKDSVYASAIQKAFASAFHLSTVKRMHQWKAIYSAPGARLELNLGNHAEWQLFAVPDKQLPSNSAVRVALEQPVARSRLRPESGLFDGQWQWRVPIQPVFKATVKGQGTKTASWLARLGLPAYRDQQVCDRLQISVPADASGGYAPNVSGLYHALPSCGTAGDGLYKRREEQDEGQPMYLFRDPTRTGSPDLDCFVFSHDKSRLDYGERRDTIARFEPAWTPWSEQPVFGSPVMTVDATWEDLPSKHKLVQITIDARVHVPKRLAMASTDCSQAEVMISCVLRSKSGRSVEGRSTQLVEARDAQLFIQNAWMFEVMRRHMPGSEWRDLDLNMLATTCRGCAPDRPGLRWMIDANTGTIKPSENPKTSALFERAVKCQPTPLVLKHTTDSNSTSLTFGINLASLAHKAASRLPSKATSLAWKLERDIDQPFSMKPFALQSTTGQAYAQDLHMKCQLFPKQLVVLKWMKQQEAGQSFQVEQAEEALLPALGWRAEVRAQAPVFVRGGICADHPGFGKTLTSLALIHSESDGDATLKQLKQRQTQTPTAAGLIPTKATLIIAPSNLVKQWRSEITDKLGYKSGVVPIKDLAALDRLSIRDFETAKIIIVNRNILGRQDTNDYAKRLADFVAMPGPATPSGRAFSQWLEHARKDVPAHVKILREQGLSQLKKHVKDRYEERLHSEAFRAYVPSKRLVGQEFDRPVMKAKASTIVPNKLSTDKLDRPLLEMFFYNRLIVDEFHDSTPRAVAAINTLCADKRWFLSGTPALNDLYDVSQIAGSLGIPLRFGSDSAGVMTSKNIKLLRTDMTSFERFDAMRQIPSNSMHARMYEQAQLFLDTFVRQNVMDFDEMPISDHLVPVRLDLVHQVVYTELSHRLSAQSMTIRNVKKSKETGQDVRFREAIMDISTAEEALSRRAATIDRETLGAMSLVGLLASCEKEVAATKSKLRDACKAAWVTSNIAMDALVDMLLTEKGLGDSETIQQVQAFVASFRKAPTAATASSKKKKAAIVDSEEDDDDEGGSKAKEKSTENQRALTSMVDTLMHEFLRSTRTLRFFRHVRNTQLHTFGKGVCNAKHCRSTKYHKAAVSALCGHFICAACHATRKKQLDAHCPAAGCHASLQDHDLLWSDTISDMTTVHPHGAKIDAAIRILETIRSQQDRAIIFVQYKSQLVDVETALEEHGISATVVHQMHLAGAQIEAFQKNKDTVIVLDASNETAAGSNLQCANHVIFLSPLLRDSQYGYHATMAQAIGRVKRHGQKKHIHIHRIIALHTIDVDILEHRECRTNALTEEGAPMPEPPISALELDQYDSPAPERVQLVEEDGVFTLRPQSWLYKCGVDDDADAMARVQGRNRVAGWVDYSSQIKFSGTFTANDS